MTDNEVAWRRVLPSEDSALAEIEQATVETLANAALSIPATTAAAMGFLEIVEGHWRRLHPTRDFRFSVIFHPGERYAEIVAEERIHD